AEWLTRALGKKAAINRDRGALNKAAELYTEAYEVIHSKTVNKTNPDTRDIAVIKLKNGILNNIADIYLRKNERDIALIYLHKMDVDTALLPLYFLTARTITIGEAYSQKHEFKKAAALIESGLRHAIEHQFNDIRLACHNEL